MKDSRIKDLFAERLQDLIADSGKKISVLASEIGVSTGTLSAYQNATVEASITKLKKIANYFGVSCDYLLGEAENKTFKNEEIRKLLDLTDDAIKNLSYYKSNPDDLHPNCSNAFAKTINYLLSDEGLALLEELADFFYGDLTIYLNAHTHLKDTPIIAEGVGINVEEIEAINLFSEGAILDLKLLELQRTLTKCVDKLRKPKRYALGSMDIAIRKDILLAGMEKLHEPEISTLCTMGLAEKKGDTNADTQE